MRKTRDVWSMDADIERICMRNLLAVSEERLFFKDREGRFQLVSAGWLAAEGGGRPLEEVIGRTAFDIFSEPHALAVQRDEQRIIESGRPIVAKVEHETFDGRRGAWVSTARWPLLDEQGRVIGTFGISRDVTTQIEAQAALTYQALHDPMTGLANRAALADRLQRALLALDRRPGWIAILFLDLDGFKAINDTYGHHAGDRTLIEIGRRLTDAARRVDTVARFGGDELVLLCVDLRSKDDVIPIADRLTSAVRAPLTLGEGELTVTVSIGAAVTADPMADPAELLGLADAAMYAAKRAGGDRLHVHGQPLSLERAMRPAPSVSALARAA